MGKKSTRMQTEEIAYIIAARNQRLFDEKAKKIKMAERAARQTEKIEKQLAKQKKIV